MKSKLVILVLTALLMFLIPTVAIAKSGDVASIEARIKAQLEASLPHLEETDRSNVIFVDTDAGYAYSLTEGLRKIDVYRVAANNTVTFKNGTIISVTNEQDERLNTVQGDVSIQATYTPYRRVKSNSGYRKTEGTIVIPNSSDLNGVDSSGEAAYNYFGLENSSTGRNAECGIYTAPSLNKGWKVFHNFNGSWVDDNWPAEPIPAGSSVFMRMYVPQDNQLALYISYSGGNRTFIYPCSGTRYNGSNQKLRRVTSLLVNEKGSYSKNNIWQNVYIATPSDMHLWQPADTSEAYSTPYTSAVETNKYYNETVNINVQ